MSVVDAKTILSNLEMYTLNTDIDLHALSMSIPPSYWWYNVMGKNPKWDDKEFVSSGFDIHVKNFPP